MPEIIDNPSFLYAEYTKTFGNRFDLSSNQTDLEQCNQLGSRKQN